VKIIAFQLSLFCKNYRFSKTVLYIINRKIYMGAWKYQIYFLCWTWYLTCSLRSLVRCHVQHAHSTLLTTLNISIQTIDCNNLQNSYVLRILCFWGEGDWLGVGGGGGGGRNISSHLRGVLNIFRRFFWGGGAKFYGRILEYPPPPQDTYFMTGPLYHSFLNIDAWYIA
jgi:hypothetical protein